MPLISSDPLLAAVGEAHAAAERAEVATLTAVLDWAVAHETTADDPGVALAGEGAPLVGEYDVLELAAALGRSTDSGQAYVGKALELRYRLPRCWARVAAGDLPVWRAFRVAEHTTVLCEAGASFVDRMVAYCAHRVSPAQLQRTVTDALARFEPEEADRRAAAAQESRRFSIALDSVGLGLDDLTGTVEVFGTLDRADALDLDHAVRNVAAQLGDLGSTDSLDVRRSRAVGEIARAQLTLDLTVEDQHGQPTGSGRGVTLYAHLHPDTPVADLDQPGLRGTQAWISQVRAWCTAAGTTVTVRPVVDLAERLATQAYTPTARIRRHVELRDRRCVFPYCTRPAGSADLDHVQPFDRGGDTSTDNLAPLCRRHHRAKTFTAWTYHPVSPGHYVWTTPSGLTFEVDAAGTAPAEP